MTVEFSDALVAIVGSAVSFGCVVYLSWLFLKESVAGLIHKEESKDDEGSTEESS